MLTGTAVREKLCCFGEASGAMDSNCAVENLSISMQSSEPFNGKDDDSSNRLDVPELSAADGLATAIDSISLSEAATRRDANESINTVIGDACANRCPDMACSSLRRSGRNNKYQKDRTQKTGKNLGRVANNKAVVDLGSLQFSRKRRSCFGKRARSSWGFLGNVAQVFGGGLDADSIECKNPRRARGSRENKKLGKNQTGQSSQKSQGKCFTTEGRVSLKIKFCRGTDSNFPMKVVPVDDSNTGRNCETGEKNLKFPSDIKNKLEEEMTKTFGSHCSGNAEMAMMFSDVSVSDLGFANKPEDTLEKQQEFPFERVIGKCEATSDNRDPGTSPDSEVINLIPDAERSRTVPEDMRHIHILPQVPRENNNKGNRKAKVQQIGDNSAEEKSLSPETVNNVGAFRTLRQVDKVDDGSDYSDMYALTACGNASSDATSSESLLGEPQPSVGVAKLGMFCATSRVESYTDVNLDSQSEFPKPHLAETDLCCADAKKITKATGPTKSSRCMSERLDPSTNGSASQNKGSKDKSVRHYVKEKGKGSQAILEIESHNETGNNIFCELGEGSGKMNPGSNGNMTSTLDAVPDRMRQQLVPKRDAWVLCDDCEKWRRIPAALADQIEGTNSRWTCKENMDNKFADCSIPQEMSNAEINAELEISDEDNADYARFNSNWSGQGKLTVAEQSSWTLIKTNVFLHRSRKSQSIDEIMVCQCKPPSDGRMGCRAGCLNRMLNIECVQGTCPCGELCSNQQFQSRKYAKLKWFRCGKKGFGLKLLEDVSEGKFLIEYVGEVLDLHAYEARQREYAMKGHKHFYFMTLNGSEVIDACAKGNLGRFINHSCDPNCRTEKWMVNGEVCIGLFALRDIKKGEEVTFDYNYVRVFGAAAKRCVCGSPQCRGFIGGDPLKNEVIVQSDSDEEYPDPIVVCEDGDMDDYLNNIWSATGSLGDTEAKTAIEPSERSGKLLKCDGDVMHLETTSGTHSERFVFQDETGSDNVEVATGVSEVSKSPSAAGKLEISQEIEGSEEQYHSSSHLVAASLQSDDVDEIMSADKLDCSVTEGNKNASPYSDQGTPPHKAIISKPLPDKCDTKLKLNSSANKYRSEFSKFNVLVESSPSVHKRGKLKTSHMSGKSSSNVDNKLQDLSVKSTNLQYGYSNGRFEGVEDKLNELLDPDGGISKRKDASKGYLKLLLLTAASGDSGNGEAIQSNRDLSMILDALLKTKSKRVLVDVINKNGLQMLHNIMKRYRKEFNKIPILRKLLKVLEYMAMSEVLTLEHINGGPARPGVESFRDSMLALTEHDDKQVHQIARSFRDRWFPRHIRKNKDVGLRNYRFSALYNRWGDRTERSPETTDCIIQSTVASSKRVDTGLLDNSPTSSSGYITNGRSGRKRKSRWDQPAEAYSTTGIVIISEDNPRQIIDEDAPPGFSSQRKSRWDEPGEAYPNNGNYTNMADDARQNIDDDAPPGFSSQRPANLSDNARKDVNEDGPPGFSSQHLPHTAAYARQKNDEEVPPGFSSQRKSRWDEPREANPNGRVDSDMADNAGQTVDEDAPPGFSSPLNVSVVRSDGSLTAADKEKMIDENHPNLMVSGHVQQRFISEFSVSYGIPFSVVQDFGSPCKDTEGWVVAPGMQFHPFPPLPPYPNGRRDSLSSAVKCCEMSRPAHKSEQVSHNPPSTSGANTSGLEVPVAKNVPNILRGRGSNLARKHFRQRNWNNSNLPPPWIRRNAWGYRGSNSRNGTCNIDLASGINEFKSSYNSEEARTAEEYAGFHKRSYREN